MGLLSLGTPLHWSEAKGYADHVRKHGIEQFLHIYNYQKDRQTQCLLWGDEVGGGSALTNIALTMFRVD